MSKKVNLKVGDILAVHNNSGFLSPKIQFFMKLQGKIKYGVKLDRYYTHMMIAIDEDYIAEAIMKGFTQRKFSKHYKNLKNIALFRYNEELTTEQQRKIVILGRKLADRNIEYERLNFGWWIPYILSNGKIDLSPKGDKVDDKLFCFEVAAMLFNEAVPIFDKPDKVTSLDMQMHPKFTEYRFDKDHNMYEHINDKKDKAK
ncbi:MAG: hypothetical protein ACOC22_01015 [bacterium]